MKEDPKEPGRLGPKELRELGGLTYRRLHRIDQKLSIGGERHERGWRRYSFREAFFLLVAAELRDRFGLHIEQLQWLSVAMVDGQEDVFAFAHNTVLETGVAVFLATDLRTVLVIESDVALAERIADGYLRGSEQDAFYILRLNAIINAIRTMTTTPEPLEIRDETYAALGVRENMVTAQNLEEIEALSMLRDKRNRKVTIHLEDGELQRAELERVGGEEDVHDVVSAGRRSARPKTMKKLEAVAGVDGWPEIKTRRINHTFTRNVDEAGRRIPVAIRVIRRKGDV